MSHEFFKLNSRAALLAAIAAAYPVIGHAVPAARVDFTVGNVTAVSPGGQSRTLAKGAQVDEGETINTNNGRAQLRFTDGAYVSLQPESQFRIDQYRFEGKTDGSEKGWFSLLKGGLRTITGLVGRNNKKNYQIATAVATIGIRGTEYTIQYGQSITGTVGEGEIEVCNGAGCLSVTDGESYYVQNQEVRPVLTNKRTDLPPPPPEAPPQAFRENENVTEEGDLCTLFPEQCQVQGAVLTGTFSGHAVLAHSTFSGSFPHSGISNPYDATVTLDSSGRLVLMDDCCGGTVGPGTASFAEFFNDGIITWGRLTDGTLSGSGNPSFGDHAGGTYTSAQSFHYLVGIPVISQPTGTINFSLLGGTAPTFGPFSGTGTVALGTLTGASLTMNFGLGSGTFTLDINDPLGAAISFGTSTSHVFMVSGSTALFSGFGFSGTGAGCVGSCFASIDGFFAGANAERAGFAYEVDGVAFNCASISGCGATGVVGLTQ